MSDKNDIPGKVIPNHDYDGIEELDNPLPRWWLQVFWGTIIFAVAYYGYYQLGSGPSLKDELKADQAKLTTMRGESEKESVASLDYTSLKTNTAARGAGASVYQTHCAACHLADGGGIVGPNLTDNAWLHGDGSIETIYEVIAKGVPTKGMPAWEVTLKPDELKNVVAFVYSLIGTTPATAKAPQGQTY